MLLISVLSCATFDSCVTDSLSSRNERNRCVELWFIIYSSIRRQLRYVTNKRSRYSDGLDGRRSKPGRSKFFSFPQCQSGSGAHPASYQVGIRGIPLRVKRPGHGADQSPSSAEIKNGGDMPPLPRMSSWRSA
jgi:hypothetical protein